MARKYVMDRLWPEAGAVPVVGRDGPGPGRRSAGSGSRVLPNDGSEVGGPGSGEIV